MGTYTPNYQLLKAGDGTVDPVDDYVDVISQLDRNLSMIDDFGKRACEYQVYDDVSLDNLPLIGNHSGDKVLSNYDQSAKVWDGSAWQSTDASSIFWADAPLNAAFQVPSDSDSPPGFYIDSSTQLAYLRGIVIRTSLAIWPQGSVIAVFPVGSLPRPSVIKTLFIVGSYSTTKIAQFYILTIATDGSASITKYGNNAQTAGNAENYVGFGGLWYDLS